MGVPGNLGWRSQVVADAVPEIPHAHPHPIGTIELTCPRCTKYLSMNCYRIAEGPFGTRKVLHFLCPACSGIWSVAKGDEGRVLATITTGLDRDQTS